MAAAKYRKERCGVKNDFKIHERKDRSRDIKN